MPPPTSTAAKPTAKSFPVAGLTASIRKLVAPKARSVTEHFPEALVVHEGAVPVTWAVISDDAIGSPVAELKTVKSTCPSFAPRPTE